jgi:ribosomal protein S18 acetylase RimI-like enzyme
MRNHVGRMELRSATRQDVQAIAALHADSWQRNYRGAFLDAYLDGDVLADRLVVWAARIAHPGPNDCTIVAERHRELVGFAHINFDEDDTWGALVDNLHVVHAHKGLGIGTRLLTEAARSVLARPVPTGLYLWVLEQNTSAQAFYAARGGREVGRELRGPFPGGGTAFGFRIAWPDPNRLLRSV